MRSSWPVDVVALNPVSCGAVLWRAGGLLRVTVVVKATFSLSADGDAALLAAEPIEREDRHHDEDPSRSLRAASDTAPYLPGAGVVLTGQAHAPRGAPVAALSARLALFRDRPLLDKTIHVFGDVAPGSDTPGPFQTMPLVYERAQGGPSFPWNPVGLSDASDGARADALRPAMYSGRTRPNVVNPASPHRPAAFGPIAPRGDGANLGASNLEGADLEAARFAGASFVDANLRGAKAERGDFTSARFDRADLGGVSFRNARLTSAVLAHARLELTDLRGADLERANLHGAARRRAKLAGAKLKDSDEAAPASPEEPRRP
ncbi:DUF2169 domain-containing protein [Sorangium sp. So ce291]|uniref:DUF2169 family type VI secretion system accessory protein n=1 Tax=Sorangium sp. So ce291 TaxID=3133294 RepID=UPI003F60EF70